MSAPIRCTSWIAMRAEPSSTPPSWFTPTPRQSTNASRKSARGHASPRAFYVDKLVEGVATIAAAFWPKPVIVRLSDFKSNEYRKLIGGSRYEPEEENPMLGFRGASRYVSAEFGEAFAMECEALKRVRSEMGLSNVEIMVPFVRTLKQAKRVVDMLAERGLRRAADGGNAKALLDSQIEQRRRPPTLMWQQRPDLRQTGRHPHLATRLSVHASNSPARSCRG